MKIFIILLMVVGISLIPSSFTYSYGLSCAAPNTTQSFEESDVVFVGEVISKEYLEPSNEHSLIAESLFSIKEPFKGIFQDHVKVSSDEKFWGINFTQGLEYLVFADYSGSEIQSQLCGPTTLLEFSNIDLIRNISENNILPPLKQISSGIVPENVTCNNNFDLIFKSTDNSPVCVKPSTAEKLIERGWAKKDFPTDKIAEFSNYSLLDSKKGNFDILYSLQGSELVRMTSDPDANSLIINLENSSDGKITIHVPRDLVDALISYEIDDAFFVLIDGEEVDFKETSQETKRILEIKFPKEATEIEIIGTHWL